MMILLHGRGVAGAWGARNIESCLSLSSLPSCQEANVRVCALVYSCAFACVRSLRDCVGSCAYAFEHLKPVLAVK